jgi:hypothetical protein
MTFTEAAEQVLRLVGKPLHYKKITEIAIERNLLSHVGKTPEITMSSRLATMVKKDRGDAPIVKVKPGVFGLRDFSEDVLKAAESESGHDYELPDEPAAATQADEAPASTDEASESPSEKSPSEKPRRLPGAEMFPEEDDDDEPILAKLDQDDGADRGSGGRRTRKRRRRKGKDDNGRDSGRDSGRSDNRRASDDNRSRRGGGSGEGGRSRRRESPPAPSTRPEVKGDWHRGTGEGEGAGQDLADAVEAVLSESRRNAMSHADIAEQLTARGRLTGDASALAPTVAAAIWGDNARRRAAQRRLRFRTTGAGIALLEKDLPTEAVRAEQDVWRAAERQRDAVHKAFLRRLSDMPATSFMELVAGWLNAEGVAALRGVRPPIKGGYHIAGTLRAGGQETGLAVAIWRDGTAVGREHVIEVRGALHHYGNASAAWILCTGRVQSGAREEAAAPGQTPCFLFDGGGLANAMERMGIGLQRIMVPLSLPDFDLLDAMSPSTARERPSQPASSSRRTADKKEAQAADATDADASEAGEESTDDTTEGEAAGKKTKRRRRRRGSRSGRSESSGEASATESPSDDASDTGDADGDDSAPADTRTTADAEATTEAPTEAGRGSDTDAVSTPSESAPESAPSTKESDAAISPEIKEESDGTARG